MPCSTSKQQRAPHRSLTRARLFATVAVLMWVAGCGKSDPGPASAAGDQRPPPEVGVIVATPADVELVTELPGRVEASRVAQVRARVAGIVQKRRFAEGSAVKAGQTLFSIDSAPYAASLDSAKASLAKAQANLAQVTAQRDRYRPLVDVNAISKQDYVNAEAAVQLASADVATAKAAVRTAEINLGYATVTAPISGRIGRALVTEGALVGQGEATPMALIQQIDPVYVNFTQSASEVLKLRRALQEGRLQQTSGKSGTAASVRLLLDDGSTYPQPGKLLFTDLTVDPTTGQVTLRAEVPNPQGELLPGLYVRVLIEQAQASNAITVPQQAVTRTQQGDTLYVVAEDGKVAQRTVKVSAARDNRWVVTEGLKAGEQVMVDGFQKLQMLPPGASVKPVPWQATQTAAPPKQAAASAAKP